MRKKNFKWKLTEILNKKIKLDRETLVRDALKIKTDSCITNQEIENFLKIINAVINQTQNEGKSNNQDTNTKHRIRDILKTIGEEILLNQFA